MTPGLALAIAAGALLIFTIGWIFGELSSAAARRDLWRR